MYNYTQVNTDIVNRVYNSSLSLQINTAFRNQFVREGADKFATNKMTGLSKMFKKTLEKNSTENSTQIVLCGLYKPVYIKPKALSFLFVSILLIFNFLKENKLYFFPNNCVIWNFDV